MITTLPAITWSAATVAARWLPLLFRRDELVAEAMALPQKAQYIGSLRSRVARLQTERGDSDPAVQRADAAVARCEWWLAEVDADFRLAVDQGLSAGLISPGDVRVTSGLGLVLHVIAILAAFAAVVVIAIYGPERWVAALARWTAWSAAAGAEVGRAVASGGPIALPPAPPADPQLPAPPLTGGSGSNGTLFGAGGLLIAALAVWALARRGGR